MIQETWEKQEGYPHHQCSRRTARLNVAKGDLSNEPGPWKSSGSVHIDGGIVPNTLIDLGAAINVMTKETMLKLNLQGTLRKTTMVFLMQISPQ